MTTLLMVGCTPTVKVDTDEPITINLNIKLIGIVKMENPMLMKNC